MLIKKNLKEKLSPIYTKKEDIKDDLTSTDTDKPLSAKQGKELKTLVDGKENSTHNQDLSTINNTSTLTVTITYTDDSTETKNIVIYTPPSS